MDKIFVFTTSFNCGKILYNALKSFYKHQDHIVNVFGTIEDLAYLEEFKDKINFIDLTGDEELINHYKNGHSGTALIFSRVMKKYYGDYKYIVHFDSDVYFNADCLIDITDAINEGYDLIGQRRPYKYNKCNVDAVRGLNDTIGTCFFGMNLEKLSDFDFPTIHRMTLGALNPIGHMVLDFFDPVSFDVMKNGGKVKYLDFTKYGSANELGSWDNGNLELNTIADYGDNIIHFAGVGSGKVFYETGSGNVPASYADWAKERYSLYVKLFYDETINVPYNQNHFDLLKDKIK